jgi:hypothetical protein
MAWRLSSRWFTPPQAVRPRLIRIRNIQREREIDRMSLDIVLPEKLAMLVHRYREALAPDFGCRSSASTDWEDLSQEERSRMVAAIRLALLDLRSSHLQRNPSEYSGVGAGSEGKECGC